MLDVEDKKLLSGHISMLLGDYSQAQDQYLQSSQPVEALHMRRDLLQWDQALTLADRYGTIFSRTSIYSPHSQWRPCTCAEICSSGTRHSR